MPLSGLYSVFSNEEARVHTSFLKDTAPLPGRAVIFNVRGEY